MSEGKYCVYSHAANGQTFYVGSGRRARPFDTAYRGARWRAHVEQAPAFEVKIHAWTDDRDEALSIETAIIEELV